MSDINKIINKSNKKKITVGPEKYIILALMNGRSPPPIPFSSIIYDYDFDIESFYPFTKSIRESTQI